MNTSTSEYSSGCESGWTMYLDQHSNSTNLYGYTNCQGKGTYANEEEYEDLSMVSDASSAPPPGNENGHYYVYASSSVSQDKKKNKHKNKAKEGMPKKQQNLCLDDTASSPIFDFSQGNVPPSGNHNSVDFFAGGHFEDESKSKKHLSFFKSSTKGKSGSLLGRKKQ